MNERRKPYPFDQIEPKWQATWDKNRAFHAPNPGEENFDPTKPKFYVLDMFPYPSGAGLHVGHPEGQTATDIGGKAYPLTLSRLNPQVKEGRFTLELQFNGGMPPQMQPGQSVDARLSLGQPSQSLLLPDGMFYTDTGGAWIFVLNAAGNQAERRAIKLGRRAANQLEVISGLKVGERVIVSSYRDYRDAERLRLSN